MPPKRRVSAQFLISVLVVTAVAGAIFMFRPRRSVPEEIPIASMPPNTIYYTGPRKAMSGNSWGNEDGTVAQRP